MRLRNYKFNFLLICVLLLGISFASEFGIGNYTVYAAGETAQIRELEEKKADYEAEIRRLQRELKELESQKGDVSAEKNRLSTELAKLQAEAKKLGAEISKLQSELNKTNSNIKSVLGSISDKETSILESRGAISKIIRSIYDADSYTIFEFLLSGKEFSSFFANSEQLSQLRGKLTENVFALHNDKASLLADKSSLEDLSDKLAEHLAGLKDQNKALSETTNLIKSEYDTTKAEEEYLTQVYEAKLKQVAELEAEIRKFEEQLHFILNKGSIPAIGSQVLAYPLTDVLVTQLFGKTQYSERLYISGSHSGVDFRAAIGTPVYAVSDGVVEGVGNTDDYCRGVSLGRWVFIRHNDINLATAYGHLSSYVVKKGQKVDEGDLIGYSGNSGHTTGPHLHVSLYISKGDDGELAAQVRTYDSISCPGKSWEMPIAPTRAYIDLLGYMKALKQANFKLLTDFNQYFDLYGDKF